MKYTGLLFPVAIVLMLVSSCKEKVSPLHDFSNEGAKASAELFLQHMRDSDVVALVESTDDVYIQDSAMHEQMSAVMAQFLGMQYALHGGISDAVATRDTIVDSTATVLMNVTYGDKLTEQVLMQMVYRNGSWKMR